MHNHQRAVVGLALLLAACGSPESGEPNRAADAVAGAPSDGERPGKSGAHHGVRDVRLDDGATRTRTGADRGPKVEVAERQNGPSPTPIAPPSGGPARRFEEAKAIGRGGGAHTAVTKDFRAQDESSNTESFTAVEENSFRLAAASPLSTFSIDVDTASYSVVRRFLQGGSLPPAGAVRLEEMVNYFPYDYAEPEGADPFAVQVDGAACPWQPRHRLVRIGLKGRTIDEASRPASNLVFLIDVSGSMNSEDKLPLLVKSLTLLAERLREQDRVALAVYAGSAGLVLPSTPGSERATLIDALARLRAGGSTNGGSGIRLAYATAREQFIKGGINRVLLCTDGDFNVGTTGQGDLVDLVRAEAKAGVFLTVLGFGTGNLKDSTLEAIADKGNGNYAYIDSLEEGRKVLVEQAGGTLHAIAKDVKIQVEFNAARVAGYRLLGYENRMLAAEDFRNDKKDAGEIGAGHTVTALYEVVPVGETVPDAAVDTLKYGASGETTGSGEMLTVRLRFKEPDGDESRPLEVPFTDAGRGWAEAGEDFRFAASVACFAMTLGKSAHSGTASYDTVRELAADALGDDKGGYRREFLTLVDKAAGLAETKIHGTGSANLK